MGRGGTHFQVSHWTAASGMGGLDSRGTKILRMRTLAVLEVVFRCRHGLHVRNRGRLLSILDLSGGAWDLGPATTLSKT